MTRIFVLDENSIIIACTGKDEKDNTNSIVSALILNIFNNGHKIAINKKIRDKYFKQLKNLERVKQFLNVGSILHDALFDSTKMVELVGIKTELKNVKECDKEFVAVARHAKAVLVTTDGRLDIALGEAGLKSQIEVMRPEQANGIAQQSNK